MANTIKVAGGFSIGNNEPADDRNVRATIADRNSIESYRRYIGLKCSVLDSGDGSTKTYQLQGGIFDSNWVDVTAGGNIEVRDTNATAGTIPLRDSNGNFTIKLQSGKIFVGNSFGNAQQIDFPNTYPTAGQLLAVNPGRTGFTLVNQSTLKPDWSNIQNKPTFATVATTGSYNDLTDKPTIPSGQLQSDWNQTNNASADYIKNKPTIPAAQIQVDWAQVNTSALDYIKNKPTIPAAQVQSDWNATTGLGVILNKPTWLPSSTPGANKQVIFNDNGVLAGDSKFYYDKSSGELRFTGLRIDGLNVTSLLGSNAGGYYGYSYTGVIPGGATVVGGNALSSVSSLSRNTVLGANALISALSAVYCLALGHGAGSNESNGDYKLIIETTDRNITKDYLIYGNFQQRFVKVNGALIKRIQNKTATVTGITGTASSATSMTLVDSTKTFITNQLVGYFIKITGGTGNGQVKYIGSNTSTTIYLGSAWETIPDNTSTYTIISGAIIKSENLSSEYFVNLTNEDYAILLPGTDADFYGASVGITVKLNPNSKTLYVLTQGTEIINPGNAKSAIVTSSYQRLNLLQYGSGEWIIQ